MKRLPSCDISNYILGARDDTEALFCECKWTNEKVGVGVLACLINKSKLFKYDICHYYLFSKNGFTVEQRAEAELVGNVYLVGYEDILYLT